MRRVALIAAVVVVVAEGVASVSASNSRGANANGPGPRSARLGHDQALASRAHGLTGIQQIQHVVIIMQENRTFDNYFGTFHGADGIPGLAGHPGKKPCLPDPRNHGCDKPFHDKQDGNYGGPHTPGTFAKDMNCTNLQQRLGCKMNGFVRSAEAGGKCTGTNPRCSPCTTVGTKLCFDAVGYHTAADIPNY